MHGRPPSIARAKADLDVLAIDAANTSITASVIGSKPPVVSSNSASSSEADDLDRKWSGLEARWEAANKAREKTQTVESQSSNPSSGQAGLDSERERSQASLPGQEAWPYAPPVGTVGEIRPANKELEQKNILSGAANVSPRNEPSGTDPPEEDKPSAEGDLAVLLREGRERARAQLESQAGELQRQIEEQQASNEEKYQEEIAHCKQRQTPGAVHSPLPGIREDIRNCFVSAESLRRSREESLKPLFEKRQSLLSPDTQVQYARKWAEDELKRRHEAVEKERAQRQYQDALSKRDQTNVVIQVLKYTISGRDEGTDTLFWWHESSEPCVFHRWSSGWTGLIQMFQDIQHLNVLQGTGIVTDIDLEQIDPKNLKFDYEFGVSNNGQMFTATVVKYEGRTILSYSGELDLDRLQRGWNLIYSDHCKGKAKPF